MNAPPPKSLPASPIEATDAPRDSTIPPEPSGGTLVGASFRWNGPIPPPQLLKQYEAVCPGLAKELALAPSEERAHRHDLERQGLKASIESERRGTYAGVTVATMAFSVAAYALHTGNPATAAAICGVNLVAIIGAFVSRDRREKERPTNEED